METICGGITHPKDGDTICCNVNLKEKELWFTLETPKGELNRKLGNKKIKLIGGGDGDDVEYHPFLCAWGGDAIVSWV